MAKKTNRVNDPKIIELVKKLKQRGFFSKTTNLKSGRSVSKYAASKAKRLAPYIDLDYKAYKVSRSNLKKGAAAELLIINNRIVGPSDRRFKKRIDKGNLGGILPVAGGELRQLIIPMTVTTLESFLRFIRNDIDKLKYKNESFMFKLRENKSTRTFIAGKDIADWITSYSIFESWIEGAGDIITDLIIYRLHPRDAQTFLPDQVTRQRDNAARRALQKQKDRQLLSKYYTLDSKATERKKNKDRIRQANKRKELTSDPKKLTEYLSKMREKNRESRVRKNDKAKTI
jgi:hypothetical protein